MMKNTFVLLFCFLAELSVLAQNDSILNSLEEVTIVADKNLKYNSVGYKIVSIYDSIILQNKVSFTSLLRYNTSIYLREYGAGGTSSARFRGTSSSNTAVVWNGININSINNGSTGFNSLSVNLMDNIDVRSGGGSIKYGSGAIGGTIHLNSELSFKDQISNQFVSSIGSYKTYQNLYKFSYGTDRFVIKVGGELNQSENDYPWLGTEYKNENGSYKNYNMNISAGLKLSEKSKLSLYLTKYQADRHFSGELPNPSSANEKYKDFNQLNLLVYEFVNSSFSHIVKAAFLTQEYNYYSDKDIASYDYGKSETYLGNYDFSWRINSHTKIELFSEYNSIFGSTNEINVHNRKQFSQAAIFAQNFPEIISYNLKIRKDVNSDYEIPMTVAFGLDIPISNNLKARFNGSTNYRVPTYNDLYWPGQGNLNLDPETSKQIDAAFVFKKKMSKLEVDFFLIHTKDKIIWIPNGDPERPGVWVPINISSVENKGIDVSGSHVFSYSENVFNVSANYSYVLATDLATNKQLIFTPKHLFNATFSWSVKRWETYYQFLYTGKIYTSEDNLDIFSMSSFDVSNIGVDYKIIKTKNNQLALGVKINNLYNEIYQTSPRRPMPNRNVNLQINYKF